jgi:hypothetical protein
MADLALDRDRPYFEASVPIRVSLPSASSGNNNGSSSSSMSSPSSSRYAYGQGLLYASAAPSTSAGLNGAGDNSGASPGGLPGSAAGAKVVELTVRLLAGSDAKGSSLRQKVLHLELADEADPFFLHSLTVGEADFAALAAEQVSP